jgi:hypothetical protein
MDNELCTGSCYDGFTSTWSDTVVRPEIDLEDDLQIWDSSACLWVPADEYKR